MINSQTIARSTTGILLLLFVYSFVTCGQNKEPGQNNSGKEWTVADLIQEKPDGCEISGSPELVDSPHGKAVYFNGVDDALFLDDMPLSSLQEFTVEMIFFPDTSANFEQRILHFGEVNGNRMLIEIRVLENSWYLDGFVASGQNQKALIDETLLHPLRQWVHIALVVGPDRMSTYVNGKQELSESFSFPPIENGQSSIGVRQNKRSWYKGMIYKVRISPRELEPQDFLKFE